MEKDPKKEAHRLERLLSVFDEDIKAEFLKAFKGIVDRVLKLEGKLTKGLESLEATYHNLFAKIREEHKEKLNDLEAKIEKKLTDKITAVDERVATLKDGEDADEEKIIETVLEKIDIPQVETIEKEIEERLPQFGTSFRDGLELLQGDERLDQSAIKGLSEEFRRIEQIKITSGKGGVARGFQLYVDGTKKGLINTINLKAGTGTVLTHSLVNGMDTVTISASAVSAGYQSPTGTVNGVNKTFVFAVAPNAILVDGVIIRKTQSDGTANWTGTTTVVLTVAPNFEIFSIA